MTYDITQGGYTALERRIATSGILDVEQAVQHLREDARTRSIYETLSLCGGMKDTGKAELRKSLVDLLMKSDPSLKRDSVDKNVRNWLADGTQVISKASALQLAFALRIPIDNVEAWLVRLCGEAFHWRDPDDIVWIFGLINGLSYRDTVELHHRLNGLGLLSVNDDDSQDSMTSIVRQEVVSLGTEAELEDYLRRAGTRLGRLHNTAYRMFTDLMDVLQNPSGYSPTVVPADSNMSVRDIIVTYMYNDYIPRARRRGGRQAGIGDAVLSALQRSIQKNWPDETTLSRMKNREIDVTRKVLILLFLATDGGESIYGDIDDADEIFASMEVRLNLMLADCGFPQLDSRTPFDWMVLYCMYADESIFLEDYMRSFLEGMFAQPATTDPGRK